MSSIFIDHHALKPYYTESDVTVTNIYKLSDHISSSNDYMILTVDYCKDIVISFNIKSITVSIGYVCLNGVIISKFHISKGSKDYPHLILLRKNSVNLILDKYCTFEVNMMCIKRSRYDIIKKYRSSFDNFDHRVVKVNDFSPNVTYHTCNRCKHEYFCTLDDYDVGRNCDINNIDPHIVITKIRRISKIIIQLLNI